MEKFTNREAEIYKMLKEGKSRSSILADYKIPVGTLGYCLSQMYQKTDNKVHYHTQMHKFDELVCFIRNNPNALDEMVQKEKKAIVKPYDGRVKTEAKKQKTGNKQVLPQPLDEVKTLSLSLTRIRKPNGNGFDLSHLMDVVGEGMKKGDGNTEEENNELQKILPTLIFDNLPSEVKITIYNLQQKYNDEIIKAGLKKEVLDEFAKEYKHVIEVNTVNSCCEKPVQSVKKEVK